MSKTFSIISLGCFRNNYDSERIKEKFIGQGYNFVSCDNPTCIHTVIINTCGFVDLAKKESLGVIEDVVSMKRKGKVKEIVVFGCLVKRYENKLKKFFPQVDKWYGVLGLPERLNSLSKVKFSEFIKISEGCLNHCSYCAIPNIKGTLASKSKEEIIREVKFLEREGVKELVFIGQDLTSWGKDLSNKNNLTLLLKEVLLQIKKIPWIRLLYLHPQHVDLSLIDLIANEKRICKYVDLPIQHINDRILKLMNRNFSRKDTVSLMKRIRRKIPAVALRTSLIVGFPTETNEEFKELSGFVREMEFERLGVFSYSREEGTLAYRLKPQVHYRVKEQRVSQLMQAQKEISLKLNRKKIGKKIDVLIEKEDNGCYLGRSEDDAPEVDGRVFVKRKGLKIGQFYRVEVIEAYEYDLVAV